ncbi:hypothetical protein N7467_010142 [Penicillium canescens]|nr:hypothetical protein N7467_010142 [Penicillium canescens]
MLQNGFCAFQAYVVNQLRSLVFYIVKVTVKKREALYSPGQHRSVSPLTRIPSGAWDSHMHVIDPGMYPLSDNAIYTPKAHTLDQAIAFESSVNICNIVLVQPSIYGNDNSCLLEALRELGPERARGVVTFDVKSTPSSQLHDWHEMGVRGVRINLQSVGKSLPDNELESMLHRYADAIRPLNWVLQLYVPLHAMVILEAIAPQLHVRLCIDHFGHPLLPEQAVYAQARDPYTLPGFQSLVNLLAEGNTFVKLSAPYRISKMQDFSDLEPVATELLKVAGKTHVVFATDWPHTRFEEIDIKSWVGTVFDWCGEDPFLAERLFRGNAEDLWA